MKCLDCDNDVSEQGARCGSCFAKLAGQWAAAVALAHALLAWFDRQDDEIQRALLEHAHGTWYPDLLARLRAVYEDEHT